MKAFRFVLVVVLLSVVDISLLAAQQKNFVNVSKCSVSVSKNSGSAYKLEDVRNFVVKEIRPELSNSDNFFKVNIKSDCGNGNVVKVSLTMNGKNYYITEFNGVDLPDRIETYNNRLGVDLNKETFVSLLLDSVNYDFGKPVPDWDDWTYNEMDAVNHKQKILKMFAFVFAESARFKDAETALGKTFAGDCRIDWHDFDFLVHNWKNLSTFVIGQKLLEPKQLRGGGSSQLISGISSEQVSKFVTALKNGEKFDFYNKAAFFGYEYECCE